MVILNDKIPVKSMCTRREIVGGMAPWGGTTSSFSVLMTTNVAMAMTGVGVLPVPRKKATIIGALAAGSGKQVVPIGAFQIEIAPESSMFDSLIEK